MYNAWWVHANMYPVGLVVHVYSYYTCGSLDKAVVSYHDVSSPLFSLHAQTIKLETTTAFLEQVIVEQLEIHISIDGGNGMQMYFSAIPHKVQQKSQDYISTFRWYCHFDDDVYVNVPVLMRTLREHKDKQYLGHWHRNKRYPFHYASGAGYCISSSLMSQLEPFVRSDPTTCTHFKVSKRLVINLLKVIASYFTPQW